MKPLRYLLALLLTGGTILSCSKSSETLNLPALADYYPLTTGKYIAYQLDSTVYKSFGTRDTVIRYQVKYLVDTPLLDNLGRSGYRIIRFIRKDDTHAWTPDNTFMAVPTENSIEFIENNLRFIKLKAPLSNGYSWKGNSYIDTYSGNSELQYMDGWDYTYDSIAQPVTIGNFTLDNTLKVNQRDEIIGDPSDPASYSEINYSVERYAKDLGLIYKEFFHSEFQPGNGGYYADGSYGIRLTLIDHN